MIYDDLYLTFTQTFFISQLLFANKYLVLLYLGVTDLKQR